MIEGITYILKQECVNSVSFDKVGYSQAEVALLKEETYTLNSRAQAISKQMFLPTADNYRFALKMYIKSIEDNDYKLEIKGHEWDLFVKSFYIRHKIVHPKNPNDFNISDEDLNQVNNIYFWVVKTTIKVLLESYEHLTEQIKIKKEGIS